MYKELKSIIKSCNTEESIPEQKSSCNCVELCEDHIFHFKAGFSPHLYNSSL